VNVGMKQQILSPAVQNREETDLCAEVAGIGGNGLQRGGAGGEQDLIQQRLVAQNQIVELFRDGENHVVVIDGQQFSLPAIDPLRPGQILALRAMSVAAGVVGVSFFGAVAALLPMAPERGGTARFDGMHQPELMKRQCMLLAIPGAVGAEDAGHLEGGPGQADLTGGGFPAHRPEGPERFGRAGRFCLRLIERTDDGGHGVRRHSGISSCSVDSAVTQEHLDGARVGSVLEEMSREAVAQDMRRHALFNAGHATGVPADLLNGAGLDMSAVL
jgi:hypothetical protein